MTVSTVCAIDVKDLSKPADWFLDGKDEVSGWSAMVA